MAMSRQPPGIFLFATRYTYTPMTRINLSSMVLSNAPQPGDYIKRKKPNWLRAKLPGGPGYQRLNALIEEHNLHTVCKEAKCPNMGECWARGTATLMILGDTCTRACGFCHIKTGRPGTYDDDEPRRVGEAAGIMRLKHIVITSVNRDELPDGGASIWAATIREIRRQSPGTQVEVLIPDFEGDWDALQLVLDERPEILNHNLETVPRLYPAVRPQAKYHRSIELLRRAKAQGLTVKTGIMVGIGERTEEVEQLMRDVIEGTRHEGISQPKPNAERSEALDQQRVHHALPPTAEPAPDATARINALSFPNTTYPGIHEACDILTIGQYLQPTRNHLPISRWVTPEEFERLKHTGQAIGFRHVESGPLVRSSYHADEQVLHLA